jgi:hypothetical protein
MERLRAQAEGLTPPQPPPDGWHEAQAAVEAARNGAIEAIDAVEAAMRDELANL